MTNFWAKTNELGLPGISVLDHMLNVGSTAQKLVENESELLRRFGLTDSEVGALAALHDIGKLSPGFQRKCPAWLEQNGLAELAANGAWEKSMEGDHGKISHAVIQNILATCGASRKCAQYLAAVLGAHHGRLNLPNPRGFRPDKGTQESISGIQWERERDSASQRVLHAFGTNLGGVSLVDSSPGLWWLAGLTTVADWIGSDEHNFSADAGLPEVGREIAASGAVRRIGMGRPEVVKRLDFSDLFALGEGTVANEMQCRAVELITGPGVYVIEAPMGMGKTEAALWAAYELIANGKARGIYFALPTQVTSNRIHLRVQEFVSRICVEAQRIRLVHGNSWLVDEPAPIRPAATLGEDNTRDARAAYDWFGSGKRALLAPFGVGTVDQALLGVVAAKHFFVRHFALAGKVVIIDEVHSYDLYTGTLINKLVGLLSRLGCTVIVLSATLTAERRGKVFDAVSYPNWIENETHLDHSVEYPLISGISEERGVVQAASKAPPEKNVAIEFVDETSAGRNAVELATKGAVVLWICNTVDSAQQQYASLSERIKGQVPIGLLHSRFPFWRREELENEWMARLGKTGETRCGSILVSTQIVEQSVDLDADLLISELAPTDMLLQRVGRLWRHERSLRPVRMPEVWIIEENASLESLELMAKGSLISSLGPKSYVYDPYILLRSLQVWKRRTHFVVPAEIRTLIEATYEEREDEPPAWAELMLNSTGKAIAHAQKAIQSSNIWSVLLKDEEGVQTRLNEVPTTSLIMCTDAKNGRIDFLDGESHVFSDKPFNWDLAKAIQRNLVRVPSYCFEQAEETQELDAYVRGAHAVATVSQDGQIAARSLKKGTKLRWSGLAGIVVEREKKAEQRP